jgi:hypothetical protein
MQMAYIQERDDQYQVVTEQDYFDGGYAAKSFIGTFEECVSFCNRHNYQVVPNSQYFFD